MPQPITNTFSANTKIQSSQMNTNFDDAVSFIGFRAYMSGAGTALATGATLPCDTEDFDTNANYNNSTYIWTCTIAGYYNFRASTGIDTTVDQTRYGINLVKTPSGGAAGNVTNARKLASGTGQMTVETSILLNMSVNDTMHVTVYENAAGNPTFSGGSTISYFEGYLTGL